MFPGNVAVRRLLYRPGKAGVGHIEMALLPATVGKVIRLMDARAIEIIVWGDHEWEVEKFEVEATGLKCDGCTKAVYLMCEVVSSEEGEVLVDWPSGVTLKLRDGEWVRLQDGPGREEK